MSTLAVSEDSETLMTEFQIEKSFFFQLLTTRKLLESCCTNKHHPCAQYEPNDYYLFPCFVNSNHFVLFFLSHGHLFLIDSLPNTPDIMKTSVCLQKSLSCFFGFVVELRNVISPPQQKNSIDCGVFVLAALRHFWETNMVYNSDSRFNPNKGKNSLLLFRRIFHYELFSGGELLNSFRKSNERKNCISCRKTFVIGETIFLFHDVSLILIPIYSVESSFLCSECEKKEVLKQKKEENFILQSERIVFTLDLIHDFDEEYDDEEMSVAPLRAPPGPTVLSGKPSAIKNQRKRVGPEIDTFPYKVPTLTTLFSSTIPPTVLPTVLLSVPRTVPRPIPRTVPLAVPPTVSPLESLLVPPTAKPEAGSNF